MFGRLGDNGHKREDLRETLNVERRSPERSLVNNHHQEILPGKIMVVDLREALDVLNRREDELAVVCHNSPFS